MITRALWTLGGILVGWLAFGPPARARTSIEDVLRANIRSDLAIVREVRDAKNFEALKERLWTIETELNQQQQDLGF
ncbi:MAG: hypothetical protein QOD06_1679 [Candidatus Binatota bacterium]|nr:hypothetical protein [Candidatus Binatota bacterium]